MKIKDNDVLQNIKTKQLNAKIDEKQTTDFIEFENKKRNISESKTHPEKMINISEGDSFFITSCFIQ